MLDKCVFLIDKVVWYVLIYLLGFLMCCLFEFIFFYCVWNGILWFVMENYFYVLIVMEIKFFGLRI